MIDLFIEWMADGKVFERRPVGICRFEKTDGLLEEINWKAASMEGWLVPRQAVGPCADLVFPDVETCETQTLRFGAQMLLSYEIGNSPVYGSSRDLVVRFKCETSPTS